MTEADLIVIGAGPAGMAAAAEAAGRGLSVLLLDEQPRPGGQIYRDLGRSDATRRDILGRDYTHGAPLIAGLGADGLTHLAGATVWRVDPGPVVAYSRAGHAAQARGKRLLIATGAIERPMPIPGWTLPGVMTAGAGQILLKASGLVAERAVLAGSGPLLYLLAVQMVRAGTPPVALVETQGRRDLAAAMRHLGGAALGAAMMAKGAALLAQLRLAGVPRFTGAEALRIAGGAHAEALHFRVRGQDRQIAAGTVFLHHGVVPNTQIGRALDLTHDWSARQAAFLPRLDRWGRSSDPSIFVAGDGGGIMGARAAALSGRLAALEIARDLGALREGDRDLAARPLRLSARIETAARAFVDRAYPPFAGALCPDDDTIICRCEELRAGTLRRHAALGCLGPNQTKAFSRAGMGPCQGRYCAATVSALLAAETGRTMAETGSYRIRFPIKPVTLAEIAALDQRE